MKFMGTTPKINLLLFLFAFRLSCTQSGQQNPTQFTVGIINPDYDTADMHLGFIEGLARYGYVEGKNITGFRIRGSVGKALDWLLQVFPDIKNLLVPIHYDSPATKLSLEDLQLAASLKGKPAGEIPAEISEFFMGINLNTAQRSGITIPNDILVQADDIIPYRK